MQDLDQEQEAGSGVDAADAAVVEHAAVAESAFTLPGRWLLGPDAVAAWPTVALVGSYELLMVIIRSAQIATDTTGSFGASGGAPNEDPHIWFS
jgi:hypothetical protein